ncbi:MAG: acyl-CoA synthetase [Ardenticatenaceae bacterium]
MSGIASLADVKAFESVPLKERDLPNSTYDAIKRSAQAYPNTEALIFFLQGTKFKKSVTYTFRDLIGKMNQTANMLHDLGVKPNDTVSYVLPNLPQTYFTLFGGEAAGIANPINPLLEAHTIAEIMNAAQTKVLVTLAPFPKTDIWDKMASIVDQVPTLSTILRVDIAGFLGGFQKLAVNVMRIGKDNKNVRARVLDFDKTLTRYPTDRLVSGRTISKEEIAAYFHTGGTTGTPKLAMHSHFNQVFDAWVTGKAINNTSKDRIYLGLPLFHNYGAIAIGLGNWVSGAGVVMGTPQGFRGEGVVPNLWQILDHYECTKFSAVPTLFKTLLNVPIGNSNLSKLEVATCGAAPLPVELARQFTEKTGIKILEGYGLTESTSVASVNPIAGTVRIGSIGYRLPYQEMRTAILDGKSFVRFCEPNEVGIVILRGPNAFSGYRDDFHNQTAFIDTGDGKGKWVNTGDLGRQDEDGYFWLTGRKKELIIRGGHNIDPKQIEEPMHRHPAVALAAAVGRPDPRVGELPVVYIELKPDSSATTEQLMTFARENIGERAAIPKKIYILDELPLTAVGKIYKPTLSHEQVADVYNGELKQIKGIANAKVTVEGDKRLGKVARVHITAAPGTNKTQLEETIRSVLGNYVVHYELKIA